MTTITATPILLVPARAGVILRITFCKKRKIAIPRTRGGDPKINTRLFSKLNYSPHARG